MDALHAQGDILITQLPFSMEAEQSVLGAILLEPSCLLRVMERLTPDCFYREQHREIYSIMVGMSAAMEPVDFVTVLDKVRTESIFASYEDAKVYLTQLVQVVPSTSNVESYAAIVRDKYDMRRLMSAARDIIDSGSDGQADVPVLIESAERKIYEISRGLDNKGLVRLDEIIMRTYDRLQKLSGDQRSELAGLPTGFSSLDSIIMGLNKTDLILIAARPGMGKTAFALNIAADVAKKRGKEVAIFSLEMGKEQLAMRLISCEGLINSTELRTGALKPDGWVRLAMAAQVLSKCPMYIDDSSVTVAEIKSKLRTLKNLGLVIIDYLQLMSVNYRSNNRVQEISEITRSLKLMAKELDVPVVVLSQLSRGPDSRSEHRPMLSDLRESGSIEQDADIVMFLYRDDYYNKETAEPNVAECIVAKNRHGETDTVRLSWSGQFMKFVTMEYNRDEG